uniref:Uncharacterized protein n=1 Tax=Physcomitrium patens TaxID=3218 RepID=A0A2K1JYU5_PHYPA|nr:hypothetical protein PHYPA_013819 [Physcomitrium patens]
MWVSINPRWRSFTDVGVRGVRNEVDNARYAEAGRGKLGISAPEMWEVTDAAKAGHFIPFAVRPAPPSGIVAMTCEMRMILWTRSPASAQTDLT